MFTNMFGDDIEHAGNDLVELVLKLATHTHTFSYWKDVRLAILNSRGDPLEPTIGRSHYCEELLRERS